MLDLAGESILIAAGGRAILLQLADPAVGRGVAEHSDFVTRPLDRLHATLTYVYTVAFGTPEELAEVVGRVNRAHVPVHGSAEGDVTEHPSYNAFSAELQLWVAATLYDSAATMYGIVFGELDPAVADELYDGYEKLATSLQVPDGYWPRDRAEFARYWESRRGTLAPTSAAVAAAHALLYPQSGPLWLRALMPLGRLITTGLLPSELREPFDLQWSARLQRRFDRVMRLIRLIYPKLPRSLRHWPKNHYLRALRSNIAVPRAA